MSVMIAARAHKQPCKFNLLKAIIIKCYANFILFCFFFSFSWRSIGVLAYVMLTGMSPFLGADKQETFLNISQINVSYAEEELERLDKAAIHFIKSLLVKEPEYAQWHLSEYCYLLLA